MHRMSDDAARRKGRRWKDMPGVEKYAFIQSQSLFWGLYAVAICLVATNLGVGTAILVFGGGILVTAAADSLAASQRGGLARRR